MPSSAFVRLISQLSCDIACVHHMIAQENCGKNISGVSVKSCMPLVEFSCFQQLKSARGIQFSIDTLTTIFPRLSPMLNQMFGTVGQSCLGKTPGNMWSDNNPSLFTPCVMFPCQDVAIIDHCRGSIECCVTAIPKR